MDETSKQQVKETRVPRPAAPGLSAAYDYEYERNGVSSLFMLFAPLDGWRRVEVRERRTKVDWAHVIKKLVDEDYPDRDRIVLVMDNLNTHKLSSLYEAFEPADSPPDMVGSCLVCFQGVSGCRPGVTHDMIGHRTGSRAPSLRVSAAVRCQLWLFSVRRRHGPAWQLGRVAYKPMLQAGSLCSIRLGSQRQYPLPRPEQQLV